MRIVVLDFETYWNSKDGYTLSKVGPLEYIRDPRFYVQCVALRVNKGNTYLFQGDDIGKALKAYNLSMILKMASDFGSEKKELVFLLIIG